jgi:hypothetical protein
MSTASRQHHQSLCSNDVQYSTVVNSSSIMIKKNTLCTNNYTIFTNVCSADGVIEMEKSDQNIIIVFKFSSITAVDFCNKYCISIFVHFK